MTIVPGSRPKMTANDLMALAGQKAIAEKLILIGVRGYYKQSMGEDEFNERGIYDDAMFLYSDTVFMSFNANVDPSSYRKGHGTGSAKGMAELKSGLHRSHALGLHRGSYLALVQTAGPVTVVRDGNPPYEDTGYFGINIHKGGINTTSSLGCQTIHPSQWSQFINLVKSEMNHHKVKVMPYLLVEV